MSGYRVVLADPPWSFGAWFKPGAGRTAASHYQTMTPANTDGWLHGALPVVMGGGDLRGFHVGMGHYTRSQTELCLLGIRGRMPVADRAVRQCIFSPVRQHSAKPDEQYDLIERLHPDGQRLELFARQRRPGWDVWGAEAPESIAGGPAA